jgi:hypothetical protein
MIGNNRWVPMNKSAILNRSYYQEIPHPFQPVPVQTLSFQVGTQKTWAQCVDDIRINHPVSNPLQVLALGN